jgi:hypothetical protein
MTKQGSVPLWSELPSHVQRDFREAGYESWYKGADETARLTLTNAYLKLRNLDLWQFADRPAQSPKDTTPGALVFWTDRPQALKDSLKEKDDFTPTWPTLSSDLRWDSREKVGSAQLHLKNFDQKNWPENWIQAHIDPIGLTWTPGHGNHIMKRRIGTKTCFLSISY